MDRSQQSRCNRFGTYLTPEAAAIVLPVVTTRHLSIQGAVLHGTTGFLVDECDVEFVAEHMSTLVQNPGLANELGQAPTDGGGPQYGGEYPTLISKNSPKIELMEIRISVKGEINTPNF